MAMPTLGSNFSTHCVLAFIVYLQGPVQLHNCSYRISKPNT